MPFETALVRLTTMSEHGSVDSNMSDTFVGEDFDDVNSCRGLKRPTQLPLDLFGFSSSASEFPATSSIFTEWWSYTIEESRSFLSCLDDPTLKERLQNFLVGAYLDLPITPFIGLTYRFTNVIEGDKIPVLQRDVFTRLQTFVQGEKSVTFVHGAKGFGKSFALYHLFCALSSDPDHRVLYIPDCSILNEEARFSLFRAMVAAFARDEAFLDSLYHLVFSFDISWTTLLRRVKGYCDNHKPNRLTFDAIFDQHNGLRMEKQTEEPTNLLQWPRIMPGSNFKLVISSSANNQEEPITMEDDRAFSFFERFSPVELQSWRNKYQVFPNEPNLDSIAEMTGNVPLELHLVLTAREHLQFFERIEDPTMDQVLASYSFSRSMYIHQAHNKFLDECAPKDTTLCKEWFEQYKCGLFHLANDLPVADECKFVIDRQFSFETPRRNGFVTIEATTPLAKAILSARLRDLQSS